MAINLASKYSDQIAEVFTRSSFIKGKTAETFDLTGVKTLKVYTPITVEEVDYDRDGGLGRYGAVTEMQDVVQELTMTQDKAFTLTIDKGNNLDQNLVKNAADMLRLQLSEKSTPSADKYAFKRFVTMAGTIAESEKPTRADIISKIADASQALDDALVPDDNRYLYLTSEMYKLVCTSDEFSGRRCARASVHREGRVRRGVRHERRARAEELPAGGRLLPRRAQGRGAHAVQDRGREGA